MIMLIMVINIITIIITITITITIMIMIRTEMRRKGSTSSGKTSCPGTWQAKLIRSQTKAMQVRICGH